MNKVYTAIYAVFADGAYDQTCEDEKSAVLEMLDLQAMGCTVKAFAVANADTNNRWATVEEMEDRSNEGRPVGRKFMRELEAKYGGIIELHGVRSLIEGILN